MENTISDEELADLRELVTNKIQYATVEITSAELLASFTTPVPLVPSPGGGKVLEFLSAALILTYNSAAYAANGNLTIQNETGTALSNTVTLANLLAATADKAVQLVALDTASTGIVLLENEGIELACATGNPTTGDSPLRIRIAYRTHDTGL